MSNSYLGNAFSLQMISMDLWREGYSPRITLLSAEEMWILVDADGELTHDQYASSQVHTWKLSDGTWVDRLVSVIGHEDTAKVLEVAYNRVSISLQPGDVLYVAQLVGGRLPEGSTTLPKGFKFEFFKVELVKD